TTPANASLARAWKKISAPAATMRSAGMAASLRASCKAASYASATASRSPSAHPRHSRTAQRRHAVNRIGFVQLQSNFFYLSELIFLKRDDEPHPIYESTR